MQHDVLSTLPHGPIRPKCNWKEAFSLSAHFHTFCTYLVTVIRPLLRFYLCGFAIVCLWKADWQAILVSLR